MQVELETIIKAGQIAQRIKDRQDKIAFMRSMIDDGWRISQLGAQSKDGRQETLILDVLDVDTSKQALSFALQIYEGQIAALQKDLETL
jgi:hypothetical protein